VADNKEPEKTYLPADNVKGPQPAPPDPRNIEPFLRTLTLEQVDEDVRARQRQLLEMPPGEVGRSQVEEGLLYSR